MPNDKIAARTTAPNERFATHVTSTTFHLSLSKGMIICLIAFANQRKPGDYGNVLRAAGLRDTFVGTARSLAERGLIEAPDKRWPGIYNLTRAGELTVSLLMEAGMVERVTAEKGGK
jgi:hypothetical protein